MNTAHPPQDAHATLAQAVGLAVDWTDAHGQPQRVSPDSQRMLLAAMGLDGDPAETLHALTQEHAQVRDFHIGDAGGVWVVRAARPPGTQWLDETGRPHMCPALPDLPGHWRVRLPSQPGYYRCLHEGRDVTVAVAPARCPTPADRLGGATRAWGVAAQLYSLRAASAERHAGGHGDFAALSDLARAAARQGAQAVAISPVHAGFASAPERYSPYSPSSRLFLNILYGNPEGVLPAALLQAARTDLAQPDLAALEAAPLIDWPATHAARLAWLRALHARLGAAPGDVQARFQAFRTAGGQALRDHAVYESLATVHGSDWRAWPDALRQPRSAAADGFAATHAHDVQFHQFAQWLAAESLARAQHTAREAGMRIGLLADLAIGTDPRGSQAWSDPDSLLPGVAVGAPPDILNRAGQDWGLTAFSPRGLRTRGYAPFIQMLRAALAHAGGVRIDHVLGMARLWLVPQGASPAQGAYLHYPLDDLLRLTRLEAWRHEAVVVGENLGTVPAGFNARLAASGVLGMDVLWFAQAEDGTPLPPAAWSPDAVAMTTTHDLPTLSGWWQGTDIGWRARLGQYAGDGTDVAPAADPPQAAAQTEAQARAQRDRERHALWQAMRHAGVTDLASPEGAPAGGPPCATPDRALLAYVASSPTALALFPLEDLAGLEEQPNLPNSGDAHPNWQRRLPTDPATLLAEPACVARIAAIRRARTTS